VAIGLKKLQGNYAAAEGLKYVVVTGLSTYDAHTHTHTQTHTHTT